MTKYAIGLVTIDSKEVAKKIALRLVEEKLAACVNIINGINSIYRWKGNIEESEELLLIIKTRKNLIEDVMIAVKKLHTYTTPEIIFFSIDNGDENYLNWIGQNTLFTSNITKDKQENQE
jgi:periplasmic divalent cation tolerance protein